MTDETLKYYIALQPKFGEAMGEWRVDDFRYSKYTNTIDAIGIPEAFSLNHYECEAAIRLPLPIDPRNPERGLWGMLQKTCDIIAVHSNDELVYLKVPHLKGDLIAKFEEQTLELALLKALAYQWGVEVGE